MENRFNRAIRAWSGELITAYENPESILRQNLRELEALVPRMNANLQLIKEAIVLLEKELHKVHVAEADLTETIKLTIRKGRDDLAANYCLRLDRLRQELAITQAELQVAQTAYERATDVKRAFLREIDRKTREAAEAVRERQRSEAAAQLAAAVEQFDVNGLDATHRKQIDTLCQQTASYESKLEVAAGTLDVSGYQMDLEIEQLRSRAILDEIKAEMQLKTNGKGHANDADLPPLRIR